MMALMLGLAAAVSTYLGGWLAIRLKDRLHLILGFSAGAVIGLAFFDLLPEALELGQPTYPAKTLLLLSAVGFLGFMLLNQVLHRHPHEEDPCDNPHQHQSGGALAASSLSVHSLVDGVAIGLAYQASPAVGAVVAAAVLAHDFSDGINTVSVVLKEGSGQEGQARRWLLLDAAAPLVGVLATRFFTVPEGFLSLLLALFAGFFLYIGASDLVPESHHRHPKLITSLAVVAGALVLWGVLRLAES